MKLLSLTEKKPWQQYLTVFLCTFALMLVILLPFVLMDNGYFIYIGDYNCQQIPFYIEANESIRNGELMWNWNTDLGSNFIGSYAFYLIGSPFFWLTLLLPMDWVAGSIPFLIVLKTAVAATTAYGFLKRFLKEKNNAFIGSLLYAFSGFCFYNIFFNHFHDIIAFFPLLLIGLEKLLSENKKGFLCFAVFLNALTNYYFFVAEVVFVVIYFFVRVLTKGWPNLNFKRLCSLAFECVAGFALAAFIVLPAVLTTLQIDRASTHLEGWAWITYYEVQRPYQILQAFFLPPEICSSPNVFPDAGAKWSSVTAWLPLFGFTGAMTWLRRRPRDFFSHLCVILFVMAFVPILNSMFQLFSNNYYTRWFFAFVLMLALITMKALEECSWKEWKWGIGITALISLGLCVPQALIYNKETESLGLVPNLPLLYAHIAITVTGLILVFFLLRYAHKNKENITPMLGVVLTCFILLFGLFYVGTSKASSSITNHAQYVERNIEGREKMTTLLQDGERIDTVNSETNAGMYWNMPTIRAFHSVVPGSIFDFYHNIGQNRDVNTEPQLNNDALHALLSVRYLIDGDSSVQNEYPNYTYSHDDNGNRIYTFDYHIPMGFSYDTFITRSQLEENFAKASRPYVMLNTLVVEDAQADALSFMTQIDAPALTADMLDLESAVAARRTTTVENLTYVQNGFTCSLDAQDKQVIFFSVPYENGWTATINGKPAEILRVNLGFIAVVCESGANDIAFSFTTPGLSVGFGIAGIAAVAIIFYIGYDQLILKKRKTTENLQRMAAIAEKTLD